MSRTITAEVGTTGVLETLDLSGDAGVDVAAAVALEHACTDAACDIRCALEDAETPFSAAYLLVGATETPLLDAVLAHYGVDGREMPRDWDAWVAHHSRYGVKCDACGAYTYGDDTYTPEECGNCLAKIPTREDRARVLGEEHGRAAASWFFDGNTSEETYRVVLRGLEDGDPAVLDSLPSAPLSGEWADDPTPASVLQDLGVDADTLEDWEESEIMDAYEDGFYTASRDAIETAARANAWVDVGDDARYGFNGVAWRIVRKSPDGSSVHAVMIGDDAEWVLNADDLTPLGEDDYCSSCGQVGCSWH